MEFSLLLFAALAPFLYALTNHIDNILLEKYFKEGGVGTLMLFSALLAALALPVLYFIDNGVFEVLAINRWLLAGVGLINTVLLWAYLQAIFNDEPTVVITYYQLVPVLGLILGYLVLGETITNSQLWAMILIILGAVVLTFAMDETGALTFRFETAGYMLVASLCWATESTFFKVVALDENPTRSFFWEHVSLVVIGLLMFTFIRHYRTSFLNALRVNSKPILGLNVLNEGLYISGNYVAALVVVMIPVSLTLLMNSFQPLFVLVIGLLLTVLFPNSGVEYINRRNMVQKLLAIALTGAGVLLLGGY
jgi:drug/metabolite transporter (DMT)-like permease